MAERATELLDSLFKQDPNGNRASKFAEVGVPGLKHYAGRIYEEFVRPLQGSRAIEVYKEMGENDPTVAAVLFAVKMLCRQTEKRIEPADDSAPADRAAELVETALDDMSHTWEDGLTEILSMLQYGFSVHELVYKYRRGVQRDPGKSSRYTDGLIGWRKWPIRSQDSLDHWDLDEHGGIQGFYQRPPTGGAVVYLPIDKILLFRPEAHKGSPEGRSVLRSCYRPWLYKKRIEEIEGIGIARDLGGYPVLKIPGSIIAEAGSNYHDWTAMASQIKRDEQEGAVIPSDPWTNPDGTFSSVPMYSLELLVANSRRQFDTTAIIQGKDRAIATSVMADFLFLGQQAVGSWALASSKTSLFTHAIGAWQQGIAAIVNRHAIPRLMALNNIPLEAAPTLVFDDIEQPDHEIWGKFLSDLSAAGFNLAGDPEIESWLRRLFNMPELSDEDIERMTEADTSNEDETRRIAQEEYDRIQREREAVPVEE